MKICRTVVERGREEIAHRGNYIDTGICAVYIRNRGGGEENMIGYS